MMHVMPTPDDLCFPERVLRTKHVVAMTGLSRMTIYRLEQARQFPPRRRITAGTTGWFQSEVLEWLRTRPQVAA